MRTNDIVETVLERVRVDGRRARPVFEVDVARRLLPVVNVDRFGEHVQTKGGVCVRSECARV
jgi:hypothetical protein